MRVLAVLRSRPSFRRLFLANAQSQLGSGAAYVALLLLAYHRLHSGWGVALVLLCDFLPGIALSAPFGALADRCDRRRLAVAADVIRAGAFVGIALVPSLATTIAFALLAGVGGSLWRPAVNSALPGLVAADERSAATAAWGLCMNVGMTAGPALSALVLLFASPGLVLIVNAATFAVSALLIAKVGLGRVADAGPDDADAPAATWGGICSLSRLPGVFVLIAVSSGTVLAGAMMNVAEPILSVGPLHGGASGYGLLVSLYGIGMVAGTIVNSRAPSSVAHLRVRWLAGLALTGVMLVGSGIAPALLLAAVTFALTGAGNAMVTGPEMRLLQELTPERMLGRVFGVYDAVQNTAFVIAFVLGGALLGTAGPRSVFIAAGGLMVVVCGLGAWFFRPGQSAGPGRSVFAGAQVPAQLALESA